MGAECRSSVGYLGLKVQHPAPQKCRIIIFYRHFEKRLKKNFFFENFSKGGTKEKFFTTKKIFFFKRLRNDDKIRLHHFLGVVVSSYWPMIAPSGRKFSALDPPRIPQNPFLLILSKFHGIFFPHQNFLEVPHMPPNWFPPPHSNLSSHVCVLTQRFIDKMIFEWANKTRTQKSSERAEQTSQAASKKKTKQSTQPIHYWSTLKVRSN